MLRPSTLQKITTQSSRSEQPVTEKFSEDFVALLRTTESLQRAIGLLLCSSTATHENIASELQLTPRYILEAQYLYTREKCLQDRAWARHVYGDIWTILFEVTDEELSGSSSKE